MLLIAVPHLSRRVISGAAHFPNTQPPNTVTVVEPSFLPSRDTSKLRATWLGHACYLVEFPGGLRVLFDPVFEPRCSPFSFMGPKRYTRIPCDLTAIPTIDAVVISHNHYDHLSYPTVKTLAAQHPNLQFFVPLGNEKWFKSCGLNNVTEMDWWERRELRLSRKDSKSAEGESRVSSDADTTKGSPDDIIGTIGCLPCQHITGRGLTDRGHTLWASWSVESGGKKVWFAGYVCHFPNLHPLSLSHCSCNTPAANVPPPVTRATAPSPG
jgi:N-acyl-phosphatidylethanolamine-hydrolysing phospholipase D